jgi:hypothetical protein
MQKSYQVLYKPAMSLANHLAKTGIAGQILIILVMNYGIPNKMITASNKAK